MKINILGASGSGTTTLGRALALHLGFCQLDADDYYWQKTDPPYQIKNPYNVRNASMKKDFVKSGSAIVSGSLVTWDDYWKEAFDLTVFLYVPHELRIERLKKREALRYGNRLLTDAKLEGQSAAFISWASKYDDDDFDGRSLQVHNQWLNQLQNKVLRIEGNQTTDEQVKLVVNAIERS